MYGDPTTWTSGTFIEFLGREFDFDFTQMPDPEFYIDRNYLMSNCWGSKQMQLPAFMIELLEKLEAPSKIVDAAVAAADASPKPNNAMSRTAAIGKSATWDEVAELITKFLDAHSR